MNNPPNSNSAKSSESNHAEPSSAVTKPLAGIKVLELGQLVAGPFCGQMLAYFGADVIKVESPGRGDPLRSWRLLDESGTSYWWYSLARNKRSVTIDLNQPEGRELVRGMLDQVDVLIENFRPGKMESWGLGPEEIKKTNPELVYTRVSGYGQDGPNHSKPGFASACEAFGGFRHVNGFADRPPVRPNLSMGDTLAGMHGVIGTLLALFSRTANSTGGQVVDVSIFESVYNLLEGVVPEYSGTGVVREPSGSTLTGIVPTNTYRCNDGKFVVIGGNGDSIFKRLMVAAGRPDMAEDVRMADNRGRVEHEPEIDAALEKWTSGLDSAQLLKELDAADVPSGPIYSVADMFEDEHYRARGLFEPVTVETKPSDETAENAGTEKAKPREFEIPAMHPKLQQTPGGTEWPGPELGAHSEEVFTTMLGLSLSELDDLRERGVI